MDRLITTLIGVVVAIGGSAIIFIGANWLFDLAPRKWRWFTAGLGGAGSLALFLILWGNRVIHTQPLLWTLVATVVGLAVGWTLGSLAHPQGRLLVGAAGGALLGLLVGLNMRDVILVVARGNNQVEIPTPIPSLSYAEMFTWLGVGLAVGVAFWLLRGRRTPLLQGLLFWGSVGWLLGTFGFPDLGTASRNNAILASTVFGAIFGAFLGSRPLADAKAQEDLQDASKKYIFLTPALFFIAASLVIPTIRTAWLSFLGPRGRENVGWENYTSIFTDANIINLSNWRGIFTSNLFYAALIFVGIGILAAWWLARDREGDTFDFSPSTIGPIAIGIFLFAFAVFTVLRGTIINNIWWVFTVTIIATVLGLAIAVLADRSSAESIAKSLIFMPMAISFVGAGIIWRFMYIARPPQRDQTGVLNAIWAWLGRLSNSSSGTMSAVIVLGVVLAALLYLAYRGWRADERTVTAGSLVTALPILWLIYRFIGPGIGGFEVIEASGQVVADPIQFTSESPFNNLWLMVVLIWIQTGFTMVIFSAAIKAVPAELLEASRVDGATESQTFWRITIPQIAPTIGVVVTTLIVTVMKVFDIVRVMTAGNFDTNVIANEMYDKAFTEFDFGAGSALAVVLFLAVLPIMFYNIRRMQKAAV
ncbi:MAG: sugar ABC transporter permease [Acidimicrobiia bacterium]|nr:sugar ABC transporter permease [Acidimicrobiia bacterium]